MSAITRLQPQDAALLVPLLKQVHALHLAQHPDHYAPMADDATLARFLTDWIARAEVTTLIAGPAPKPAGYLIFEVERRAASVLKPARHRAMLHHICVDAAARRRGLATALIAEMRTRCRAAGIPHIATSYAAFNTASARLMASVGLEPVTCVAEGAV